MATKFSLGEAEDVLAESPVVFKKQQGTLLLTSKRLVWNPVAAEIKFISLPLNYVTKHTVSVAGSPQCLLKITAEINKKEQSLVMLFEGTEAETERTRMRDILSSLINSTSTGSKLKQESGTAPTPSTNQGEDAAKRRKTGEGADAGGSVVKREFTGAKKTLMENDPDLRVLYDEVVGSGLVTDEEFWEARKDQIRQVEAAVYSANPNNSQRTGLSSELASEIRPVKETNKSVHFRLTPSTIHQIFVEYPNVQRAYKEYVPAKMSEKEFWTKFLQSQYFKGDKQAPEKVPKGKKGSASEKDASKEKRDDDMFAKLTMTPAQERAELQRQIRELDPTINLAKEAAEEMKDEDEELDEDAAPGTKAIVRKEKERRKRSQALIKKFNRHGQLVLDSFVALNIQEDEDVDERDSIRQAADKEQKSKLESSRAKIAEQTEYRDLEEDNSEMLSQSTDSAAVWMPRASNLATELSHDDWKQAVVYLTEQVDTWKPGSTMESVVDLAPEISEAVCVELFRSDDGDRVIDVDEDPETLRETEKNVAARVRIAYELVHHFWTSLLATSRSAEIKAKLKKIADALTVHFTRLKEILQNFASNPKIATMVFQVLIPVNNALKVYPKSEKAIL